MVAVARQVGKVTALPIEAVRSACLDHKALLIRRNLQGVVRARAEEKVLLIELRAAS